MITIRNVWNTEEPVFKAIYSDEMFWHVQDNVANLDLFYFESGIYKLKYYRENPKFIYNSLDKVDDDGNIRVARKVSFPTFSYHLLNKVSIPDLKRILSKLDSSRLIGEIIASRLYQINSNTIEYLAPILNQVKQRGLMTYSTNALFIDILKDKRLDVSLNAIGSFSINRLEILVNRILNKDKFSDDCKDFLINYTEEISLPTEPYKLNKRNYYLLLLSKFFYIIGEYEYALKSIKLCVDVFFKNKQTGLHYVYMTSTDLGSSNFVDNEDTIEFSCIENIIKSEKEIFFGGYNLYELCILETEILIYNKYLDNVAFNQFLQDKIIENEEQLLDKPNLAAREEVGEFVRLYTIERYAWAYILIDEKDKAIDIINFIIKKMPDSAADAGNGSYLRINIRPKLIALLTSLSQYIGGDKLKNKLLVNLNIEFEKMLECDSKTYSGVGSWRGKQINNFAFTEIDFIIKEGTFEAKKYIESIRLLSSQQACYFLKGYIDNEEYLLAKEFVSCISTESDHKLWESDHKKYYEIYQISRISIMYLIDQYYNLNLENKILDIFELYINSIISHTSHFSEVYDNYTSGLDEYDDRASYSKKQEWGMELNFLEHDFQTVGELMVLSYKDLLKIKTILNIESLQRRGENCLFWKSYFDSNGGSMEEIKWLTRFIHTDSHRLVSSIQKFERYFSHLQIMQDLDSSNIEISNLDIGYYKNIKVKNDEYFHSLYNTRELDIEILTYLARYNIFFSNSSNQSVAELISEVINIEGWKKIRHNLC